MNRFWGRRSTDRVPRRPSKHMYLLPSLFTGLNIAAGYYALSQVLQADAISSWHFDYAAKAIGFAILFDGLDGRIARMTNTSSDFGRELDSLADVIAFGVAPAMLAWVWGFRFLLGPAELDLHSKIIGLGGIATFLFLAAGASRLARFNIQVNPEPSNPGRPGKKYFVGMPIPAGAGVVAATVHFTSGRPIDDWRAAIIWGLLVFAAGFLMVSTWRFPSFKDLDLRRRHPFQAFILVVAAIGAVWYFSHLVLFAGALSYMLMGLVWRLQYIFHRRPTTPPPAYNEAPELR